MLNRKAIELYRIDEGKEKNLWENAIFVFDSSALLDFYFLPKQVRGKIFSDIFGNHLKGKLWIPAHVQYEYLKNRENIISKPITENYAPIRNEILDKIIKSLGEIRSRVNELENRTKKDDKHPYLEQKSIQNFAKTVETFQNESEAFVKTVEVEIANISKGIIGVKDSDDVLEAFEKYIDVGKEYKFEDIMKISLEGRHRYNLSIPPGYKDQEEKKGIQIFGDLIIWKQILEFAKDQSRNIVFICNDTKEDWCYKELGNRNRIASPREELIKEINDYSNAEFWMYTLYQFVYISNKYFDTKLEEKQLINLSALLQRKELDKKLNIKCYTCGQESSFKKDNFDLDFEGVSSEERQMGPENHYQYIEHKSCGCGNEFEIEFNIWEYPVGIHNYDSVEVKGGTLIRKFNFSIDFKGPYSKCPRCGKEFIDDNAIGICNDCEEYYSMNS
jgi:hypothetical protein